ncbi:hypothetical protein AVEN_209800-1 [Araneus ventricosus]|uniref:Uncharacterized protein n=1 Tax=Araneus ventricosus TaxID=182803 RepID=A0A4Y2X3T1_ARAVE|nr:hypothetical protein AVEN_209800-1 [Araneus ventricosus]
MTTRPIACSSLSVQQPAKTRPNIIEVVWPVTAGLGVRVLREKQYSLVSQEALNISCFCLLLPVVLNREITSLTITYDNRKENHCSNLASGYTGLSDPTLFYTRKPVGSAISSSDKV